MKIVLVNLWKLNKGGTEKVFFDMANNLYQRGHSVTAIVNDPANTDPVFPISPGVHYCNCASVKKSLFRAKFCNNIRACCSISRAERKRKRIKLNAMPIRNEIEKINPDIIVSFNAKATYWLLDILGIEKPIITMFHLSVQEIIGDDMFPLYKGALERCACIQVLMPEFVEELLKFMKPKRIVHIPNVVPQYEVQAVLDNSLIINVGRISREHKRQHLIVEAFALLKEKFPEWNVECWGPTNVDPEYTHEIEKMIIQYGLSGRVRLCGITDDVASKLRDASIFALTSYSEGFGLALTEAMSMGLPAVGCLNAPGVNSMVRHGKNGLLCNDTPSDIADKLAMLMADRDLRLRYGKQARNDMRQYAPEKIWDEWETLLNDILFKSFNKSESSMMC